jgi:glucosylceramidase
MAILANAVLIALGATGAVSWWLSSEDGAHALTPQAALAWGEAAPADLPPEAIRISVDTGRRYQSILGLGASFEHATCENLARLSAGDRDEVIRRLVHPEDGIGMNLMRVCIGTSDFTGQPWYSYNDLPEGETDPELKRFSIEQDRGIILPVLKKALALNPDLLYFASPWSPPGWMKTTGTMLGGKLKPEYYGVYAQYLVKFIQAYAAEGIPIHALTPQNEPGFPNPAYPTCLYTGAMQRDFIRDHLGPALRGAGLPTRIWCWDHNWNNLAFPRTILSDPAAAAFVEGTAFHFYEGKVEAMSALRDEFPDKDIFFTEGSAFRTHGALMIINILRNWARSYNAWVVLLDEHRKPNNGPHSASATCIELKDDGRVEYRFDYYMYGQFMKFIPRGAVRVESGPQSGRVGHVAFLTPKGGGVLVAANAEREARTLAVELAGHGFQAVLPARSVATFQWPVSP